MKPLKDIFLIKPDNDGTELSIIGLDGQPLVISKRFNPLEHSPQYGEILELPIEFSKNASADIKNLNIGDKIFFHYLICEELNEINLDGIQFYFCHFGQIWGKVENEKLLPLGDVLFCEKIMDESLEQSGLIIKTYSTQIPQKLKVSIVNDYIRSLGIQEGDVILTVKGSGTEVKGTDLLWIRKQIILGIERNGEIFVMEGKNLIKEDSQPDYVMWHGLLLSDLHRNKFIFGEYIKGDHPELVGKKVAVIHGFSTRLEIDNVKYAVVTNRNLIFKQ